ncbi:hypothetical protein [Streptomyces sp. NPDC059142]
MDQHTAPQSPSRSRPRPSSQPRPGSHPQPRPQSWSPPRPARGGVLGRLGHGVARALAGAVALVHPRPRPWLRAGLALCGWPALAATALPDGQPLRWIPILLFVTFGPGCALLLPLPGSLRPAARLEALALAAPLSLSLATLTATALFLVAGFSAPLFLGALAVFCTVVAPLPAVPLPAATRGAAERTKPGPEGPI